MITIISIIILIIIVILLLIIIIYLLLLLSLLLLGSPGWDHRPGERAPARTARAGARVGRGLSLI